MTRLMKRLAAALLAALLAPTPGMAAPFEALLEHASEQQIDAPDYAPWERFIQVYGQPQDGRVKIAYGAAGNDGARYLRRYIGWLSAQPVERLTRTQQLAYWLNMHNMLVVHTLLNDRRNRLDEARGTPAEPGPAWTRKLVAVRGVNLSIDDIARHLVLGNSDDERLVYALYQGVAGGPALLHTAFGADELDAQLDECAWRFVNAGGLVKVRGERARVSPWLIWNRAALHADSDPDLVIHLQGYAQPDLATRLDRVRRVEPLRFAWRADEFIAPRIPLSTSDVLPQSGFGS